jgi:hypothetical protein
MVEFSTENNLVVWRAAKASGASSNSIADGRASATNGNPRDRPRARAKLDQTPIEKAVRVLVRRGKPDTRVCRARSC